MPSSSTPTPSQPQPSGKLHSIEERDAFLYRLMANQLRLSVSCCAAFFVILFGLPLMNFYLPELMATRIFGFTLSWFILGVLIYPIVWVISYVFIRRSIAMEAEESHWKLPK
ncbi:MAG: DUF485 domain-containing protein [Candidatus Methylacidiphilales bacterium]|nr:DUF485 domain-containing protein [Candidatus Methylacidiphilales bacterium]